MESPYRAFDDSQLRVMTASLIVLIEEVKRAITAQKDVPAIIVRDAVVALAMAIEMMEEKKRREVKSEELSKDQMEFGFSLN